MRILESAKILLDLHYFEMAPLQRDENLMDQGHEFLRSL